MKFYKEQVDKISEQNIIIPIKSQTFKCCNKDFKSSQKYQGHLISKSHQLKQLKSPITTNRSQTGNSLLNSNVCLFCDELCDNIEDCLKHMSNYGYLFVNKSIVQILRDCQKHYQNKQIRIILVYIVFQTFINSHATHCLMSQQEYKVLSKYYNFVEKLLAILVDQKQQLSQKQDQKEDENKNEKKIKLKEIGKMMKMKILIQMMIMKMKRNQHQNKLIIQKLMKNQDKRDQNNYQNKLVSIKLRQQKLVNYCYQMENYQATKIKENIINRIIFHLKFKKMNKLMDIADEKQLALLSNELIVGHLRNFYYQKTRTLAYGQTQIGQRNNLIQIRWLRKSC
ncbi:unnamed protein product [Paramecium primaurelia]|uniref:Uncharacterized protein n=1 Tax=Paramecium primaurelia TaxID=5886 RepID=A0A8S1JUQ8_PARPR|nr:unnamed protein product [Paramecium primaurelia]